MDARVSSHKRSSSDPMKSRVKEDDLANSTGGSYRSIMEMGTPRESSESKKRQYHNIHLQSSLNEEIMQLQKRLQQQFMVRHALEKACHLPFSQEATLDNSIPKAAKELIKEIGVLELEVKYLEQYLLSLYRKRFDQQISSLPVEERRLISAPDINKGNSPIPERDAVIKKEISVSQSDHLMSPRNSVCFPVKEFNNHLEPEAVLDSSIHRSHSALSQRSVCLIETSPVEVQTKVVDSYHSLPLSMLEQAQMANSSANCVPEHLENCFSDNAPETPNWISEEIIKCISGIYCELSDPPFAGHDNAVSPISFLSSVHECSSHGMGKKRGSGCKNSASSLHLNNPFQIKGSKKFSGPYCSMVKIQQLDRDNEKLKEVEYMLRRFRSLVSRLEQVDPRNMKHEEKLAFWINVHNAIVMHAFLVYGTPSNNLKRMSLVLKAAYNIGGHTVSVDAVQNIILGCRLPRPGQWLRLLLPSKTKFKVRDARKAYAIHHPEPLLLFALCSGSHSDPAVRLYTPKRVFEELESAKEEYILSNVSVTKEQKIFLPKLVDFFAKNSGLGHAGLLEMIKPYVSDSQRKTTQQYQPKTNWKSIEWIPHNFTFRYLLSKELAW